MELASGLTILVVNQDKANVIEFIQLMESINIKIVFTDSANLAISFTDNQKFFCIVSGLNLKKGKGENIVKAIRGQSKGQNKNTKIILFEHEAEKSELVKLIPLVSKVVVEQQNLALIKAFLETFPALRSICTPEI